MAKGEPGDVFHGPEPGHVVQMDQVLVAEVDLGIGDLLGLIQVSVGMNIIIQIFTDVSEYCYQYS